MKITFYSNFLNHHQLPVCKEFINHKDIEFTFVATEKVPQERLDLGYEDMNKKYDFVLTTYDSKKNYNLALRLGYESDIVIIGSAPDIFIEERLKDKNKITFRYSERIFKKLNLKTCLSPLKNLRFLKNYYSEKKYYLLCSSAYSTRDFNLIGQFKNRTFKWGYFPELKKYDIEKVIMQKENKKIQILWVGRFLSWKHPEYCIKLAQYLNEKNYSNYQIKMIGIGEKLEGIKEKIEKLNLENSIKLCGSMSNLEVLEEMKKSNIFIFTSDRGEGWGAVLNEAMNTGCAIVANKTIGSVPFLINDNENGLIYKNAKEFLEKVEYLINNKDKREKLGLNAYKNLENKWNAKIAVNNFLDLCKKIKNKFPLNGVNYDGGPCTYDK